MSESENKDLLEALNSVKEVNVGDVVKGEVLAFDENKQVIVGIEGTGVEGVVPARELGVKADELEDKVSVGDMLDLVVISKIGSDKEGGSFLLSQRRLQARKVWDDIEKKFDVQIAAGNTPNEYYFFTSIENGEDRIFDAIEYNVERMKEAIERANLLSQKTLELKALFEDESISIEQLRNLKIICPTGQQTHIEMQKTELPPIVLPKAKKKNVQEPNPNPQQKAPSPSSEKTDEVFEAKDSDSVEPNEKED